MRQRLLAIPAAAALVVATALPAFAFGATPDPGYGTDGVITLANGSYSPSVIQHGAQTYVAYDFATTGVVLERRDSTGALDPTFGVGGQRTLPMSTGQFMCFTVSASGDVYLVTEPFGGRHFHFSVIHVTADGTRDRTFGGNGKAALPTGRQDQPVAVAVDDGGRVIVGGERDFKVHRHWTSTGFVVRLTDAGLPDGTFGRDGRKDLTSLPHSAVADVSPDGSGVVVAGATGPSAVALRLRDSGAIDQTFGNGGAIRLHPRVGQAVFTRVRSTSVGTVLAGLTYRRKTGQEWLVVQRVDGSVHRRIALCSQCFATGVDIGADGSVAATGGRLRGQQLRPVLAAMLPDGSPDVGISATGSAFVGPLGSLFPVSVTIDGSALVVGSASFGPSVGAAALARYVSGP